MLVFQSILTKIICTNSSVAGASDLYARDCGLEPQAGHSRDKLCGKLVFRLPLTCNKWGNLVKTHKTLRITGHIYCNSEFTKGS